MAPHSAETCEGNCSAHPLLRGAVLEMHLAVQEYGMRWGDLLYFEEQQKLAAETLEERLARQNRAAAEEARRMLLLESERRRHEADLVATRAKTGLRRGEAVQKRPIPCKKLYSCQGDKSTGGARPTTLHVSSECWAHEYTDPVTKKRVVKHVCPWLHPGEEGWYSEWEQNRLYQTGMTAVQVRFSALKAGRR